MLYDQPELRKREIELQISQERLQHIRTIMQVIDTVKPRLTYEMDKRWVYELITNIENAPSKIAIRGLGNSPFDAAKEFCMKYGVSL